MRGASGDGRQAAGQQARGYMASYKDIAAQQLSGSTDPYGVQGRQRILTSHQLHSARSTASALSRGSVASFHSARSTASASDRTSVQASLHAARAAAGKVRGVASRRVVSPVANRFNEVRSNVRKVRKLVVESVYYLAGCAVGVVAWAVGETLQQIKTKGVRVWAVETVRAAPARARAAAEAVRAKASRYASAAHDLAKDKGFQATAASAVGGAVTLGTTGGIAGLVAGVGLGAAAGLPAAVFSFGLSIPISAAIGGTCGLVTGAAAGGTVGAVGAGAVGYGAYQRRDQISTAVISGRQHVSNVASKAVSSVKHSAAFAKEKAGDAAGLVGERASALRSRLRGGRE